MLKHVQFAAQRNSFAGTATAADPNPKTSLATDHILAPPGSSVLEQKLQQPKPASSQAQSAVQQSAVHKQQIAVSEVKSSVVTDAANAAGGGVEDFTLDKIEQSIADIEAELGWVSEPADPVPALSPKTGPESAAKIPNMAGGFACLCTVFSCHTTHLTCCIA